MTDEHLTIWRCVHCRRITIHSLNSESPNPDGECECGPAENSNMPEFIQVDLDN